MKRMLLGAATATVLLATLAPASPAFAATSAEGKLKTVYGWAKKSGNSAMLLTPYRASRTTLGESGLPAWNMGKRKGKAIRIDYTEGLVFKQVNKKCGKRSAGYPHDTYDKYGYGKTSCFPIHLYALLRKGRVPVKVVYDPDGPMAVKVIELVLP